MYSSRHTRPLSPPLSTTASSQVTTTQQSKLNVVTRLAIEGRARHGQDGASIKMYLKLSIPMDSVSPGSTLPLFPEENLKLLSALVHPLDSNSVPYNFSSSTFPMLHSAARALNLPARSSTSYLAVFGASTPAASMHSSRSSSASSNTAAATPLDDRYTGKILVSGYNIAFVLPRDFPPRFVGEESALRVSTFSAAKMRRSSISERGSMHFMAAIHLLVPFTSRPPRAPFLISIPLPRCLSNNVRLHIFPPTQTSTSASVASLSSAEEDPGSWELTSEPHVARTTTRPSRSGSYGNIADDESSDSTAYATSASGGIIIQGTFPSTERLRIRWAQPTKNVVDNADGRRRVGVKEVKGDMTTLVMGKAEDPSSGREGVLMKLEYKGSCKGVWFPGVATMLGMDVGLDARGSDVIWAPGEEDHWSVSGGVGYTGFDVGPPSAPVTRQPSLEFPSAPTNTELLQAPPLSTSSSTSSLLRAPLPADQIPDYSFEGSPISLTPSGTLSSLSSVPLTPEGRSRTPSDDQPPGSRLPAAPITIHINMNDLIPPAKNVFTFAISGTILVIPKTRSVLANGHTFRFNSGLENEAGPIPIVLPRFTVLAADSESTSTIIRNGTESATVEVYRIAGDLQDAQTRRTVLQPSSMTRCGSDGCRIALRSIAQLAVPIRSRPELALDSSGLSPRARTPTGHREATIGPHPSAHTQGMLIRRRRNGPLMIPSVHIIVTPLCVDGSEFPNGHAVHMHMHAPSDADSEWLEFGIARAAGSASSSGSPPSDTEAQPEIDIVTVSVDGIPVRFENRALGKQDQSTAIDLGPSFAEKNRSHWITWIKVHVGEGGGHLTVDYVAKHLGNDKSAKDVKGKSRATDQPSIDLLIPTFALAVGRMDVIVESTTDLDSIRSNFAHHHQTLQGHRVLQYSLEEFFCPKVTMVLHPHVGNVRAGYVQQFRRAFLLSLGFLPVMLLLMLLVNLGSEFRYMKHSFNMFVEQHNSNTPLSVEPFTETVFVTRTVFTSLSSSPSNSSPTPTTLSSSPSAVTLSHAASQSDFSSYSLKQAIPVVEPSHPPTESPPHQGENSLFPATALPFEFSLPGDLLPTARQGWEKLVGGLGVVWQVFRKVYHYPLDPP